MPDRSIAQSLGLISAVADVGRATLALSNVEGRLILDDPGLALLFTPPFKHTPHDPGYIKGYPPEPASWAFCRRWSGSRMPRKALTRTRQRQRPTERFCARSSMNGWRGTPSG